MNEIYLWILNGNEIFCIQLLKNKLKPKVIFISDKRDEATTIIKKAGNFHKMLLQAEIPRNRGSHPDFLQQQTWAKTRQDRVPGKLTWVPGKKSRQKEGITWAPAYQTSKGECLPGENLVSSGKIRAKS